MVAKVSSKWYSTRLHTEVLSVRYGHAGTPVLLFPTAGGDAEECERFLMIRVLTPLLEAGRIRVFSCDSVAGRAWISSEHSPAYKARVQNVFNDFLTEELVPAIRSDCRSADVEVICAGASIGAYNALVALCRNPQIFRAAICMSGTYDLGRWMQGQHTADLHLVSPLHFVPFLQESSPQLAHLRRRLVLLPTGEGRWEAPEESWKVANVLGKRGIPNRVDLWGQDYDHDWITWREMLPKYLAEHA